MRDLSVFDIRLLDELQYHFPLTKTPYTDIAGKLGIPVSRLLNRIKELKSLGIIKRVGFYLNYRAKKQQAALIALSAKGNQREIASYLSHDPETTHIYLRNHPLYDLWVVSKRGSRDALISLAEKIVEKYHLKNWVVLFGVKTWKLSVKYDLLEGVSKSSNRYMIQPNNIPILNEQQIIIAQKLRDLPLELGPYNVVSYSIGLSEETVYNEMLWLVSKGVLRDPGCSLDGRKLGFTENGMLMFAPGNDSYSELCECLARNSYTTHVVQREAYPPEACRFRCYAMIHAISREKLRLLRDQILSQCKPGKWLIAMSLEDLKPSVVR